MTVILDQHGAAIPPSRQPRVAGRGRGDRGSGPSMSLNGAVTAYDAADVVGQELSQWNPWLGSPDTELNTERDRVVARMRDLVRNDGWASGAVTRLLDSVVGAGFRLRAMPNYRMLSRFCPALDASWGAEFRLAAESLWQNWADDPNRYCDASRRLGFGRMARLAFRHKLVDGDAMAVLRWMPERVAPGRASFATCVALVDPDRLSNPDLVPDTPILRGGVEIDGDGVSVAYHIRKAHQSDWFDAAKSVTWERVAREHPWGRPIVVHDFDSERADQHRSGGGILMPVVSRLKMLAKYDSVELQAAIVNAIFGAFIESPFDHTLLNEAMQDGDARSVQDFKSYQDERCDFHDDRRLALGGVRIPTLYPGEKINSVASTRPPAGYDRFNNAVLRNVAGAIGISAEQISQDWSRTNYSSARAALLEAWKSIGRIRADFATGFNGMIYSAWLEEAIDRGLLPLPAGAPDFIEARAAYCRARWMGPPRGWVDPVKEKQGAVLGMDAGLSTLEHECAEQGLDWEEVLDQRAIEVQAFKDRGLPLPVWAGADPIPAHEDAAKPEAE